MCKKVIVFYIILLVKIVYINSVFACFPPVANFTVDIPSPMAGEEIVFTDASLSGSDPITSWSWDFGDDALPATASTQGPHSVIYLAEGSKTVSLIVSDGSFPPVTETKADYILVSPSPVVSVSKVIVLVAFLLIGFFIVRRVLLKKSVVLSV